MMVASCKAKPKTSLKIVHSANLCFEEKLWAPEDKLLGHMDAAEYKHVVCGWPS
jgi:type I restriction enzyme M protein